ncbi:hypothetical protein [Streptomyces sp. NBC_00620]|uniref:hypothetical protein n=1 Tax=Streptomyces sp. NBC_00620 TaxID=2903666 RepID=UPI002255D8FC|nr:hypothetical protein [Streptomyces sp. NBC_00620]MCX4974934.1 hypothetical protein [Streptomyces sp. NBC_00620]
MGFWGSFVVCRSETPLDELSAVVERHDGIEEHWRRADGWQVGQYPGPELADDAPALLAELVEETGAPALTGFVLDSDAVHVEGFSVAGGHWKACLAREATEAYCEDDDEDFDAEFPSPEAAARAAAAWASAAGRTPDMPGLAEVFAEEDSDFAEELFFRLLDKLGM